MFRSLRVRRAHTRFLESCRNLSEGRNYWDSMGPVRRWFAQTIVPMPLLGLHGDGAGLYEALQWLEANCRSVPLDEDRIRGYHRQVYVGGEQPAGIYRRGRITVVGSKIPRAAPEKVPVLMKQLDNRLKEEQKRFDESQPSPYPQVLKVAVDLYQRLGLIHPFPDANGRVARLAMNHILRRYGLPYVVFPPLSEPSDHWPALQSAHAGELSPLIAFATRCEVRI